MTAVARARSRSRTAVHSPPATRRAPAHRAPARQADQRGQLRLRVVDADAVQAARRVRRIVAAISSLVAAALVLAVVFHVTLAQGQLELDRLREQAAVEQERYERLRVEVAVAASPEEIVRRAEMIGMTEPTEIVHVSPLPGTPEVFSDAPEPLPTATGNWPTVKPHLAEQP